MALTTNLLNRLAVALKDTDAANELGDLIVNLQNISAAELGYLDAVTAGTAAASKAVVLDSSKGISTITSATITTLTAPTIAGTTALTGRVTTTDGVASGTAKVVGGLAYSNTAASAAHTNTTTEALFDAQYSVPANTLKAGTVVKIRYQGIATATNGTDTLTIKLYIGGLLGTALLTGTATDVANNAIFAGEFTLVIRTAGATGTMVGVGTHTDVPAASGTASHAITEILASTTIDTTAAQVIGVGADWSVADPGNSARLDILVVEIL
jgi:hypothetical protein